ncbi:MAG: hypothetical protein GEU95_01595 [Rhizobiales bacterium]|nr:hypothetical protein [Hyphomicrobiales bacterium]
MHNDPTMRRHPPPIATVTSTKTAIYNPPSDGFPFMAAVFSPNGTVQAFRAFPARREAEAFVQAFMQENAGEHGLGGFSLEEATIVPRG